MVILLHGYFECVFPVCRERYHTEFIKLNFESTNCLINILLSIIKLVLEVDSKNCNEASSVRWFGQVYAKQIRIQGYKPTVHYLSLSGKEFW